MEIKCSCLCTLLVLLLILGPGFSSGRMHAKKMGSDSEVYDIDYRGPETHTYNPPPNRAGPRIPHHAGSARHKAKRKNVRRNLSRKNYKS